MRRVAGRLAAALLALAAAWPGATLAQSDDGFAALRASLWPEAAAAGISRAVFDEAFAGLSPDPAVLARLGRQSEFSRPIRDYVEGAVSAGRLRQGSALAARWADTLAAIEARTGVPAPVILAVWAQESGFGSDTGSFGTVRSLATLASAGSRRDLFRRELIAALVILDQEHAPVGRLTGSWAGAMGQTQFMPSSFLLYATDGDGDGRRDIWTSVPDVLASIGTFLARNGWQRGLPWGVEVTLPPGLDLADHQRDFSVWARAGVRAADGSALPASGRGRLFFPAGRAGPALLLADNFEALRAYNTSDAYALAIGHLSDRLAGGRPFARPWPKGPVLSGPERVEVHRRLAALGHYRGTPDGKFGAETREAVRRFQASRGLAADGYADAALLGALRAP